MLLFALEGEFLLFISSSPWGGELLLYKKWRVIYLKFLDEVLLTELCLYISASDKDHFGKLFPYVYDIDYELISNK